MKQKGKMWKDSDGVEIPVYAINTVMKVKEQWAHKIADKALKAEKALQEYIDTVNESLEPIEDAIRKDAEMKGLMIRETVNIASFDGSVVVKVTKPTIVYFDKTYQSAVREKFENYVEGLQGDNENALFVKDLINALLQKSAGQMNKADVEVLQSYRTRLQENEKLAKRHKEFIEAVNLLEKSILKKKGNMAVSVEIATETGMRKVQTKHTAFI